MKHDPMIGYYGGVSAESGTTLSLRTPIINIYNKEELRAEVTYWIPRVLAWETDDVRLEVSLKYQDEIISLVPEGMVRTDSTDFIAYTCSWVLDSLEEGKQFRDLFAPSCQPGGDFSITAEVSYTGTSRKVNGARKTAEDNSLFAAGSGGDTAYIEYMRHLQNLNNDYSGVSMNKTRAVQIEQITCVEDYAFWPIENPALISYDGQSYEIRGLKVDDDALRPGLPESCGLFGTIKDKALSNIVLVNASVDGGSKPAGALAGYTERTTITNCQVYWENDSAAATNLREALGDSEDGIRYRIVSEQTAGGLVGSMEDGSLTGCFAAATVQGKTAGGLVGALTATENAGVPVPVESSYADCYLYGENAGGLIGLLEGSAQIQDCYAAGFIESRTAALARAAGFCLGGTIDTLRSYSVMLYTEGADNYPLSDGAGSHTLTCYLSSSFFPDKNLTASVRKCEKTYADLTDSGKWEELFGTGHIFEAKATVSSHPYNLQTTLSLVSYAYPGLKGMEHYGDWGAQFQNGSLVYYEKYTDGTFGFHGANVDCLKNTKAIAEDGYAVAYLHTDTIAQQGAAIKVQYPENGGLQTETLTYKTKDMYATTWKEAEYFLLPLPDRMVNTKYTTEDFYQELQLFEEGHYYYNPHFANAILPYEEGIELSARAESLTVEIRTPRHLAMLAGREAYGTSSHHYHFVQKLDLDYETYTGYGLFADGYVQLPIGRDASNPFKGDYYGNCYTIRNLTLSVGGRYVGLFGYSTGLIEDVVCLFSEGAMGSISHQGSMSGYRYVGGLVGYNAGIVRNSAVAGMAVTLRAYDNSTAYVGGFSGWNQGLIQNSAAELSGLTVEATVSNAYAGGFTGGNSSTGSLSRCYAVGRISVSHSRYGEDYACGFAAVNQGIIDCCYAVVDLETSGGAEAFGFGRDACTNSLYLNGGNFTYRETNFTAQYRDGGAAGKKWNEWTAADETLSGSLGMSRGARAYDASDGTAYPFPGIVKDASGQPVHYGSWPVLMNLGEMGVYYWEKLEQSSGAVSYHFSALKADLTANAVSKTGTLLTAHNDGARVTEYGYGYFYQSDMSAPVFSSGSISLSEAMRNQDADRALTELMEGKYAFCSYNTRSASGAGTGLSLGNLTHGDWTLKSRNVSLVFRLTPFFADSLSFDRSKSTQMSQVGDDVPTVDVGTTESWPYQVRAVDQLRFINWNGNTQNTSTVITSGNCTQFPYLSYYNGRQTVQRRLYWKQTHDVDGANESYTPIAEFYDPTNDSKGNLNGWFGGVYDGDDYLLRNINIKGQVSSCAGLFGVVYNGLLKNIVLYSTDGKGTVTSTDSTTNQSCWYAIGTLAGLAASNTGTAIENCSAAGYTIIDRHRASQAKGSWGGSGVGGLIGLSNMQLSGCSAVTQIEITAIDNDNMRIGGLVGACQQSISNCYSGGEIRFNGSVPDANGAYIGGIVGGIYMKELTAGTANIGSSSIINGAVQNCYTYVTLPSADGKYIKGLYALGGSGEINPVGTNDNKQHHGTCNITNSYYLEQTVLKNINVNNLPDRTDITNGIAYPMTYTEMSDNTLRDRLNAGGGSFSTVTVTTEDGESIKGKYSFSTSGALFGENYPFPTIQTQSSTDGRVNVHYGDWPVSGLSRSAGSLPVEIDLFADYDDSQKAAVWEETLLLSELAATGGTLTARIENKTESGKDPGDPVAQVQVAGSFGADRTAGLVITGLREGYAAVTVTYQTADTTYEITIDVHVSARLQLLPDIRPQLVLTNARSETRLKLSVPEILWDKIDLISYTVEVDGRYLEAAEMEPEAPVTGKDVLTLHLKSKGLEGETRATLSYTYRYLGQDYTASDTIPLFVRRGEMAPETVIELTTEGETVVERSAEVELELTIGTDKATVTGTIVDFDKNSLDKNRVAAEWKDESKTVLVLKAYSDAFLDTGDSELSEALAVQLEFEYRGSKYSLWTSLTIKVKDAIQKAAGTAELPTEAVMEAELRTEAEPSMEAETAEGSSTEAGTTEEPETMPETEPETAGDAP